MKKLQYTTQNNNQLSPITGWTREHWQETFYVLMQGIINSASPCCARQKIPGPRSHHGRLADEMEGFTRSFIMAGPWLNQNQGGSFNYKGQTYHVAEFYKKGILAGTDPGHREYWGTVTDYAQHLVECASLAWALYLSKQQIWDQFSRAEKRQVCDYLLQCTKVKYHHNNWLLFNVITNTVLKKLGLPYSQEQIDENINACDHMYLGSGWYRDGTINRIDYYNAWAFHYYYLIWTILDGESKPEIAEKHKERVRIFANDFRYLISGDGSTPCFGRSMIYKFAYIAPLILGARLDCLDISPGEVRTICNATMNFFFSEEILTENNHLSLGYLKPCAEILEHYSCGGSPYWAAKAFNAFILPEEHAFWSVEEEKLPIHQTDYSHALKDAGLLLVGNRESGHVQLINQKSYHDKPEYNAKYTNFVYSSLFSYEARAIYNNFNCDNSLQFSSDGINFKQRWQIENLYCETDFAAARYPLHEVDERGIITTFILVKNDFLIHFHQVQTTQEDLFFREGGFALGYNQGTPLIQSCADAEYSAIDGKISYIRNLYGYTSQTKALPYYEDINSSNVRYSSSIVPTLYYKSGKNKLFYLANMVYGKVGRQSMADLSQLIKSFVLEENCAVITFYDKEKVFMQIGEIKKVSLDLNNYKIQGKIVLARVNQEGQPTLIINQSAGDWETVSQ